MCRAVGVCFSGWVWENVGQAISVQPLPAVTDSPEQIAPRFFAFSATALTEDKMGDRELEADILDQLDFEPSIDALGIRAAVDDGVVTLTGHVATLPTSGR